MNVLINKLKLVIQKEIQDLESNLQEQHYKNSSTNNYGQDAAAERLLSRIADRNDMIRINTLRWVLEIIEKLEQKGQD